MPQPIFQPRPIQFQLNLNTNTEHVNSLIVSSTDYDDNEWPEHLGDIRSTKSRPSCSTSEPGTLKRFFERSKRDTAFYKAAMVLAGVGAGYDIRIANTTAIHPHVPGSAVTHDGSRFVLEHDGSGDAVGLRRREAFVGQRRDAYFSAVRDSLIEPETSFEDDLGSSAGAACPINNTFHGMTPHCRARLDLDTVPTTLKRETVRRRHTYRSIDSLASMTPSSDENFGGVTTSASGMSSPYKTSVDDLCQVKELASGNDHVVGPTLAFIELSFGDAKDKYSSQPFFAAPSYPSKSISTPHGPPSRVSSYESESKVACNQCLPPQFDIASTDGTNSTEVKVVRQTNAPVRPDTLDVSQVYEHNGTTGIRNSSNSVARASYKCRITPLSFTQTSSATKEHTSSSDVVPLTTPLSFASSSTRRSFTSPGCTPPHITHPRTLLDIDMDGQGDEGLRQPTDL